MSDHSIPVVQITDIRKHPNADTLGIVSCLGWQCVVRMDEWRVGALAVFIPPDFVVPETDQFAFLGGKRRRIGVMKLRGEYSQGLLMPAPADTQIGDDVAERMGIVRYEPALRIRGRYKTDGDDEAGPHLYPPKYDVENFQRWTHVLAPGEQVIATEKIHGANARFVYVDGRMYCGSRSQWKTRDDRNLWWKALACNPWLEEWCKANDGAILFGEVYGQVQDLTYGVTSGDDIRFSAFDVFMGGAWRDAQSVESLAPTPENPYRRAPVVVAGAFDAAMLLAEAEKDSTICPGQCREGIVIKPVAERNHAGLGRVSLKMVSNRYLSRKD